MRALSVMLVVALAACSSPEATRSRGGDPGADIGNRGEPVRMHEGSRPFHDTPRLITGEAPPLDPASQARDAGAR